ncbi:MAG: hypothetical protein R6U50_10525 [Desulfobacterales bacterium]
MASDNLQRWYLGVFRKEDGQEIARFDVTAWPLKQIVDVASIQKYILNRYTTFLSQGT